MKKILLATLLFALSSQAPLYAYTNKHFKGSYAFRLVGPSSFVLANQPLTVGTGVIIADGRGTITGHGTFRSAGVTCEGDLVRGSYRINPDGTGILTSVYQTATPGCITSVLNLSLALADRGRIFEAATFANDYMSGTLTKQDKRCCIPQASEEA